MKIYNANANLQQRLCTELSHSRREVGALDQHGLSSLFPRGIATRRLYLYRKPRRKVMFVCASGSPDQTLTEDDDAAADTYEYDSDADAAVSGGNER